MPIDDQFQSVPMMGHVINVPVPEDKAFISLQMQRNTATDAEMDTMLQELVDLLQTWPGRRPDNNVTAQRYVTGYYNVSPTNPVVDNSPPPEPAPEDEPQTAP